MFQYPGKVEFEEPTCNSNPEKRVWRLLWEDGTLWHLSKTSWGYGQLMIVPPSLEEMSVVFEPCVICGVYIDGLHCDYHSLKEVSDWRQSRNKPTLVS